MLPLNLIRFVRKKMKKIEIHFRPYETTVWASRIIIFFCTEFVLISHCYDSVYFSSWLSICYLHSLVLSNSLSARREVTVVEGWTKMNKSVQLFFTKSYLYWEGACIVNLVICIKSVMLKYEKNTFRLLGGCSSMI